jgi:hypothetical protein
MLIAALLTAGLWILWHSSGRRQKRYGPKGEALVLALRGAVLGFAAALTLAMLLTLVAGHRSPYFFPTLATGLSLLAIPFGSLGGLAGSQQRP